MFRHRRLGFAVAALILLTALVPLGGELWAGGEDSAPQRYALGEDPALIWMHLVTNLLIGLAYVAISGTLIHMTRKTGRRIPFLRAFVAFGVFIISCGATHFMAALTLWEPAYWIAGGVLWVTALASVGTAVAIPSIVPKVVDLVDAAQASEERRRRLLESEERFRSLLGNLQVGVLLMDSRGEVLLANGRATGLIGLTKDELLGKALSDADWDVVYEDGSPFPVEEFPVARVISDGRAVRQVVMGFRPPNRDDRVWLLVDAEPEFSDGGVIEQVVCTLSDVSERKRAEERLSYIARYDQLTGLVNRDLFGDRLDRALARSARSGRPTALMFVDLDRFKDVNDSLGHEAGDGLLKVVAERPQLGRAVENGEFALHRQPQVDPATGAIVGAEALLRWLHPDRGIVSPGEFVPMLEETGLIVPVGEWVLQNACRQVGLWRGSGLPVPRVAVNLSARQLVQGDLPGSVERIVGEAGIDPRGLELEITESHLIEDLQASCRVFEEIKGALDGIRVSVDDFGTGYSSMTYLKNLPVDTLKIGPPFVSGVPDDPEDVAIATNMIGLARSLRLDAIVEGVETREQLAFVRDQRCALAQGYYFSPPVSADDFAMLLREERSAPLPRDAFVPVGT